MQQSSNRLSSSLGFTLIELMLSIAILGVLTALSLPVYASFSNRNSLDLATQNVVSLLRRAETYSRGAKLDTQWGVEIQTGQATLFKGSSFATRNTAYDEVVTASPSVGLSGLGEVLFSKLSGLPTSTGTITATSANSASDTRTITINAKGVINY